jgi:hypothetical protein
MIPTSSLFRQPKDILNDDSDDNWCWWPLENYTTINNRGSTTIIRKLYNESKGVLGDEKMPNYAVNFLHSYTYKSTCSLFFNLDSEVNLP